MTKRKGMTGLGLTTMAPGAASASLQADWNTELARLIRDRRGLEAARAMGVFGDQQRSEETPAATTLTEATRAVVDTAKTAADLYKDMAHADREARTAAEERARKAREEADEKAARAAESVREEATTMLGLIREIMKDKYEAQIATERRLSEMESKLAKAEIESVRTELKAEIQHIKQAYDFLLQQKEQKIAELQQQNDYLAKKETIEDAIVHTVKNGDLHPSLSGLSRLLVPPAAGDDPDRIYKSIVAQGLAEAEVDKAKAEAERKKNEVKNADELHKSIKQGVDSLVGAINTARAHLPLLFGQPPREYDQEEPAPAAIPEPGDNDEDS